MQATQIRQKLHQYIDDSDEKLLKLLFAVAKEYNDDDDDFEYEFTAEDIQEFDNRREKRLSGETRTYSWEEAKDIITGKKTL
jgi:hypothetical protein